MPEIEVVWKIAGVNVFFYFCIKEQLHKEINFNKFNDEISVMNFLMKVRDISST